MNTRKCITGAACATLFLLIGLPLSANKPAPPPPDDPRTYCTEYIQRDGTTKYGCAGRDKGYDSGEGFMVVPEGAADEYESASGAQRIDTQLSNGVALEYTDFEWDYGG